MSDDLPITANGYLLTRTQKLLPIQRKKANENLGFFVVTDSTTTPSWTGKVVQPNDTGVVKVANVDSLLGVHCVGQSNATASGVSLTPFTSARFPYHVFKFTIGNGSGETAQPIDGNTLSEIVAASDNANFPVFPHIAFTYSAMYRARMFGDKAPIFLCRFDAKGGCTINDLLKGAATNLYSNLLVSITKADAMAKRYALDYQPLILFTQGENSVNPETQSTIDTYYGHLSGLFSNYKTDILAAVGKTPIILFQQTNGLSDGSNPQPTGALAHLKYSRLKRNTSTVLACPRYQMPLSDTIHSNNEGRLIEGELLDLVYREVKQKGSFVPLDVLTDGSGNVIGITRVNEVITLKLNRPIFLDNDWIPATTNYGFHFTDDSSSASISSVNVTNGSDTIVITLTANPTGANKRLSYAMTSNVVGGWSAYRGQIYAESGAESIWKQRSYNVPKTIRHYLVRFKEVIA